MVSTPLKDIFVKMGSSSANRFSFSVSGTTPRVNIKKNIWVATTLVNMDYSPSRSIQGAKSFIFVFMSLDFSKILCVDKIHQMQWICILYIYIYYPEWCLPCITTNHKWFPSKWVITLYYVRADAYGVMTAATKKGDSHLTSCYSVCLLFFAYHLVIIQHSHLEYSNHW